MGELSSPQETRQSTFTDDTVGRDLARAGDLTSTLATTPGSPLARIRSGL